MSQSANIFQPLSCWEPLFLQRSPLFEPLLSVGSELSALARWPALSDLQPLVDREGKAIRFVPQSDKPQQLEDEYEPRIYLKGEVQTRTENWHDLFNALVWLAFPKTKAVINARHYTEILQERVAEGGKPRGKVRDRLTQFDESGVVVLCADTELAQLLADHQWKHLFWEQRERVGCSMRFLVFGHSLYEKALRPYPGITGKALVLDVTPQDLQRPLGDVVALADRLLAGVVGNAHRFNAETRLQPLPLMGVPGWVPDNADSAYYDDVRYFRPKR